MNENALPFTGRDPWIAVLGAALVAALLVDGHFGVERPQRRLGRAFALLVLGLCGAAAVAAMWHPLTPLPEWLARVLPAVGACWWLLAIPVFALGGSWGGRPGARAVVRLVAASAAPAILLAVAPSLRVPALGVLAAGLARAAAAPVHALSQVTAETLSPGAVGLVLTIGLATGGMAALEAAALLPGTVASALAVVLALTAGVAGMASLVDTNLLRRLAAWTSVQAALAVVLMLAASPETPWRAHTAVAHLGASAAALPVFTFVLGRIVTWARIAELGAHGGLLTATVARAQAVLASVGMAVLAGGQAPLALLRSLRGPDPLPWIPVAFALAGWLGVSITLLLGCYRVVRGRRMAPGAPVPEILLPETSILALFFFLAVLALLVPELWRLSSTDLRWLSPR